jgi:hypothetical protein
MALNYRRLSEKRKAILAVLAGLAVAIAVGCIGVTLPQYTTLPIAIGLVFAAGGSAEALQKPMVTANIGGYGELGSGWVAFGIGMTVSVIVCILAFSLPKLIADRSKLTFGSAGEVYYSRQASREEAQSLVAAMQKIGYKGDRPETIFLDKDSDGAIVSFVVKDGFWDKPETSSSFEEVGREIAQSVGGFPLRVRLLDSAHNTRMELTVGREAVGDHDEIYYLGSATESAAKSLGDVLRSLGYFGDSQAASVFLAKERDGPTISFVVGDSGLENPTNVNAFARIVRDASKAVGGLPIKLRLIDDRLEVKKELMVN